MADSGSSWGGIVSGASDMLGSYIAGNEQQNAIGHAEDLTNTYYGKAQTAIQPQMEIGKQFIPAWAQGVQNGQFSTTPYQAYQNTEQQPQAPTNLQYGQQPQQYQAPQFNYQQDPGYQWQLQQGNQNINAGASAQGGLLSGTTQKALAKYGVGLAAQDYNNAFQRYAQNRQYGQQAYQTQLGQYNINRANTQDYARNLYGMGLGQYNANRNFGAEQNLQNYQARNQQATQGFNQYGSLAGMGVNAENNSAGLYVGQGSTLGSLALAKGNAQAGQTLGMTSGFGTAVGSLGSSGGSGGGGGGGGGMGSIMGMFGGGGGGGGGGENGTAGLQASDFSLE